MRHITCDVTLADLPYDRRHATKRHRPLAAGRISSRTAVVLGASLAAGGLALALWLSVGAGLCVLLYLAVTSAYSLSLKRHIFADVIALAVLFTVRVVAGGVATAVPCRPRSWPSPSSPFWRWPSSSACPSSTRCARRA